MTVEGRRACVVGPAKKRLPLLVFLHGYGNEGHDDALHLASAARSGGFLYAMPDAQPDQSDHREWQESDLEFLGAFVRGLVRDGSADPRRIYLAGGSR